MKKKFRSVFFVAATAAATSLLFFAGSPARAQMPSNNGASMSGNQLTGGFAVKGDAEYVRRFVFFNLDGASVRRYKAMGFTDDEIKGVGNLALQSGLPLDYFFRRLRTGGKSLIALAVDSSTPKNNLAYHLSDAIPGYGVDVVPAVPMK